MTDVNSMIKLSNDYLKGNGVEKDRDKAREWMLKAALCGSPDAAAMLFDMSRRTASDSWKEEVVRVLETFAESGGVPAMVRLSIAYRDGYGVERSELMSIEWMRKASETGYEPAASKLFDLMAESKDPRIRSQALKALDPYASSTRGSTVIRRAMAYRDGCGVEKDLDKALEILKEASGFKEKWNVELYRFAMILIREGRDVIESLTRCRVDQKDVDMARSLSLISKERLYLPLLEAFVGERFTYVDWVSGQPDPIGAMAEDFNIVINILNGNRTDDLVRPANVAAMLNGILAQSKECGILDDDGIRGVFMRVHINDPYLKQMQDGLTKLLDIFDRLCKANGIRYMISCGTLLGAYRHEGFIPWDDDTDIYMMGEDYRKLSELLKDDPVLMTMDRLYASNLKGHGVNYAHQVVFRSPRLRIIHLGVMTFDYVRSADDEGWEMYRDYIDERRRKVDAYTREDKRNGVDPLSDRRIRAIYRETMANFSKDLHGEERRAVGLSFDNPIPFAKRKLFDYEDFFPERDMKFNGLVLPAPNHPEVIMDRLYGNVMLFPKNLLVHRHAAWDDENATYIRDYLEKLKQDGYY
ncbi:MAG: LicD family protein [Candidatus Methanomethylophilaceae archaeon]|nr:LicD family protein [Candidatus Methanomethylophilaceae archaeon]